MLGHVRNLAQGDLGEHQGLQVAQEPVAFCVIRSGEALNLELKPTRAGEVLADFAGGYIGARAALYERDGHSSLKKVG